MDILPLKTVLTSGTNHQAELVELYEKEEAPLGHLSMRSNDWVKHTRAEAPFFRRAEREFGVVI